MHIKFLGTSSAWTIPYPNCNCSQCKSKDKKDKRFRSSIFIKPDILLDIPPDFPYFFMKYKYLNIKKVFITHSHSDHIFGLKDLFPNYKPVSNVLKIYLKKDVLKDIKFIFPNIEKKYFSFKTPEGFSFFPVNHSKKIKTYGILYEKNIKIAYIPDTIGIPESSMKKLENLDLLILDGTGEGENHLNKENIFQTINKIKAKRTILTHIGHWKIKHKKLEKIFKPFCEIAYDGMEIKI